MPPSGVRNSSGVFSLEELRALGQTGDSAKDWGGFTLPRGGLFPRGFYRLPDGTAVYVDPQSGQVPREFAEMVGSPNFKRHPISGLPENFIPRSDEVQSERPGFAGEAAGARALDEQLALERTGLSRQEAMRRRLAGQQGTRPVGERPSGVFMPPSSTGAYKRFLEAGGTDDLLKLPSFAGYEASRVGSLKDALAHNFMQRSEAMAGLQQNRVARGLDPETGISEAEKSRIYETYRGIQDPATRAMYVKYQDPANLVPELRQARLDARVGERELVDRGRAESAVPEYHRGYADGRLLGSLRVERGSVTQTDPGGTGRERVFGNVPIKVDVVLQKKSKFDQAARRFGGAVTGGALGLITGGLAGGVMGAYQGAGGPLPRKGAAGALLSTGMGVLTGGLMGGWKQALLGGGLGLAGSAKDLKKGRWSDFGDWESSPGGPPTGMQVGTSIGFAAALRGFKAKPAPTGGWTPGAEAQFRGYA